MLRKFVLVLALVAVLSLTGCLTKHIAVVETVATEFIHPDGPIQSFFAFGPWSDEFADSYEDFDARRRTYLRDLNAFVDDYDKHFLRYDKYDPFAE